MIKTKYDKANNAQAFLLDNSLGDLVLNEIHYKVHGAPDRIYASDAMMAFSKELEDENAELKEESIMGKIRYRCGEKFYSKGVHILCEDAQCDECFDKESNATEQAKTDRIKGLEAENAELKKKNFMPESLTAENGAKHLMSGEFYERLNHDCPECYDEDDEPNDDCHICDGAGVYSEKVYVSWTTIKEIYKKAHAHFKKEGES